MNGDSCGTLNNKNDWNAARSPWINFYRRDPTTVEYRDKPSSIICSQRPSLLNNEYHFEQFRVVTNKNGNIHIWLNSRKDLNEKINSLLSSYFGDSLPE